jgi:hypothetical protein
MTWWLSQGAHDQLKIVVREDEEIWTVDEPLKVHLQGNIEKVLGAYST